MNGSHKFSGKAYAHRCKLLCDFAHVCTGFKSLQERFKARCYISKGFLEKTNIGVRSKNIINLLEGNERDYRTTPFPVVNSIPELHRKATQIS